MCLITNQKEAFIAEEDMTVYKVLNSDGSAVFQSFDYKIGTVYKEKIEKAEDWDCLGILDIHWLCSQYGYGWKKHPDLICLGPGFHSIDTLETAKGVLFECYNGNTLFKCTIPKGSEYYKNDVGFIVSSSIIIDKMLDIRKN